MKKSVIILIALIYVAAIAVVSFFGLQFKVFNQVVPVSSIVIDNKDLKYTPENVPYAIIELDDNGVAHYQIKCTVLPVDATNTRINYAIDDQSTAGSVDEYGLVTFTGAGTLTVIITPADGSDFETRIILLAR